MWRVVLQWDYRIKPSLAACWKYWIAHQAKAILWIVTTLIPPILVEGKVSVFIYIVQYGVPTLTGKPEQLWNMGEHFPVIEFGLFRKIKIFFTQNTGKVRRFLDCVKIFFILNFRQFEFFSVICCLWFQLKQYLKYRTLTKNTGKVREIY